MTGRSKTWAFDPVFGPVLLRGGPIDGWSVKKGAPALEPDWGAQYLEKAAIGLHASEHPPGPDAPPPAAAFAGWDARDLWETASETERDDCRRRARELHGAGRYVLRPDGLEADWVAEP